MYGKPAEYDAKEYRGNKYSFCRSKEAIGSGGNGIVYEVNVTEMPDLTAVVKFFTCSHRYKEERYERFQREVDFLQKEQGIDGIVPILDYHCPPKCPTEDDEAWYMMPKADDTYDVNRGGVSFLDKIEEILRIAQIVKQLHMHEKKYAHRDIKPENILIYGNQIYLSDFGLVFIPEDIRLTRNGERIGPRGLLPPELYSVELNKKIDYRCSDVYLLAKLLWMRLRKDRQGFVGQYRRDDETIYLDRRKLNTAVIEPIHILLEKATCNEINKRIDILEFIELLNLQRNLLLHNNDPDPAWQMMIKQYQYDESLQEACAKTRPSETVYQDERDIAGLLRACKNASITITGENETKEELQSAKIMVISPKEYEISGINVTSSRMTYTVQLERIVLNEHEKSITIFPVLYEGTKEDKISFVESKKLENNIGHKKIFLSSAEKVNIHRPSI